MATSLSVSWRGVASRGALALKRASSVCGVRSHAQAQAARMPALAAAGASMRAQCSRSGGGGGKAGWDFHGKGGWWGPTAAAALFAGGGLLAATYGTATVVDCEADNSDEVTHTPSLVPALPAGGHGASKGRVLIPEASIYSCCVRLWMSASCSTLTAIGTGAIQKRARSSPLRIATLSWWVPVCRIVRHASHQRQTCICTHPDTQPDTTTRNTCAATDGLYRIQMRRATRHL